MIIFKNNYKSKIVCPYNLNSLQVAMEYRSPLGYNFKLEQSLSKSKEDKSHATPIKNNIIDSDSGYNKSSEKSFDRRGNFKGKGNTSFESTARMLRGSNNWRSPNPKNLVRSCFFSKKTSL